MQALCQLNYRATRSTCDNFIFFLSLDSPQTRLVHAGFYSDAVECWFSMREALGSSPGQVMCLFLPSDKTEILFERGFPYMSILLNFPWVSSPISDNIGNFVWETFALYVCTFKFPKGLFPHLWQYWKFCLRDFCPICLFLQISDGSPRSSAMIPLSLYLPFPSKVWTYRYTESRPRHSPHHIHMKNFQACWYIWHPANSRPCFVGIHFYLRKWKHIEKDKNKGYSTWFILLLGTNSIVLQALRMSIRRGNKTLPWRKEGLLGILINLGLSLSRRAQWTTDSLSKSRERLPDVQIHFTPVNLPQAGICSFLKKDRNLRKLTQGG